ncbi:MAG: mechanosensitive ion channel family protein [Candidatus Nanoarchaeia archaeon]|nr:mechanosensitive ion channel family protein [Candidatus Nanoarchaeia archaeon]
MIEKMLSNEYIRALIIILSVIVFTYIVKFILIKYIKKLTEKTKTDIDDVILSLAIRPGMALVIFVGIYLSLRQLSILAPYAKWINMFSIILTVFIIALLASRIFSVLMSKWFKVRKKFEKTPRLLNKIASVIIFIIAGVMLLSYFDVEITPFIATLGIGGLAVGLALQNTLSNLFAGLHIISDRPIDVGHFIEIEAGVSGFVEDIGWRSTRIRTLPNTIIIIPNSKLAEANITNYSMPDSEMGVVVQCGVDYGSDLKKVEKVTMDVAKKIQQTIPGAVKTFEPFIRFHTFADSNINFSIILRVEKYVDKYLVTHEFMKALKERYDKEGIEISWPVMKVYQKK